MCLAQGPHRSEASEAQSSRPSISSQALYHWAIALARQDLPISINDRSDLAISRGFYFHETSHMRSFSKIKSSRKFLKLQSMNSRVRIRRQFATFLILLFFLLHVVNIFNVTLVPFLLFLYNLSTKHTTWVKVQNYQNPELSKLLS